MLRWIYPTTCELCHEESDLPLCDSCRAELPRVPRPICLYCGAPVAGGQPDPYHCDDCQGKPRSFDFARSALLRNEVAMGFIHDLKYHKAVYMASALAPVLAELWEDTPVLKAHGDWVLVPVPVTSGRLFKLGYNHAGELAAALGELMGLPVIHDLLCREPLEGSQTRRSASARMQHAFATYRASGKARAVPPHLLVVDDVYTTGATVRACAQALKSLPGVRTVGALTLLRI